MRKLWVCEMREPAGRGKWRACGQFAHDYARSENMRIGKRGVVESQIYYLKDWIRTENAYWKRVHPEPPREYRLVEYVPRKVTWTEPK